MVRGQGLVDYAAEQGYRLTLDETKDYGLRFAQDGTPAEGEEAKQITVGFTLHGRVKDTIVTYNEELGAYTMSQYGEECLDGYFDVPETYENIFVLLCENVDNGMWPPL